MRGATTTNQIFSLSRYTISDIEIKLRERWMLCNDKHNYQHFIKVRICWEGHKSLAHRSLIIWRYKSISNIK